MFARAWKEQAPFIRGFPNFLGTPLQKFLNIARVRLYYQQGPRTMGPPTLMKKEGTIVRGKPMKEKTTAISIILIISLFHASSAFCHGWGGYEQGAKAKGMGGAFTGLADDPTAICYNPAGIVQLKGTHGSFGFSVPVITGTFKSNGTSGMPGGSRGDETDLDTKVIFIPNLYITHQVNDRIFLGFGEYTEFGNPFEWPDSFEGRFAPSGKLGELKTITLSPICAYKVTDRLSVALGGRIQTIKTDLRNKVYVAPGVDEVSAKVTGDDWSVGWNASMLYKVLDELSIGFNYRSKIRYSLDDMNVKFSPQVPSIDVPGIGTIPVGLVDTRASMTQILPQYASLGLAWTRGPLTVTFDTYWWDWSQENEMVLKYDNPVAGSSTMVAPMDWKDTWTWAIGTEYRTNVFGKDMSLRGGFMYEQCPTPNKTVNPVGYQGDNLLYNIGLGTMLGPVYSDFFFSYVYTKDRNWNNNAGSAPNPGGGRVTGEFKDYRTYILGNNISYKF
jgi:long-chain fatty acid transport protein